MTTLIASSSMSVCRGLCVEKGKSLKDVKVPPKNENYSEIVEKMRQEENSNDK